MKILVVDDHPLILEASRHVLKGFDAAIELLEAQSADTARAMLIEHADIALVLLDLGLPGVVHLEFLEQVRRDFPEVPVVVLSASDSTQDVVAALDLGAMGYIPKTSSSQVMLSALRLVLSGGIYIPQEAMGGGGTRSGAAASEAAARLPREIGLTERQAEVLRYMIEGKPNKLICRELKLAEGTVKIHVAAILRTLGVANRTQAVMEVSRLGLRLAPPARHN